METKLHVSCTALLPDLLSYLPWVQRYQLILMPHQSSNSAEELQGSGCHAVRGVVTCTLLGKAFLEAQKVGVGDHERDHLLVEVLLHMEEGTAPWTEQPLVEVAWRN